MHSVNLCFIIVSFLIFGSMASAAGEGDQYAEYRYKIKLLYRSVLSLKRDADQARVKVQEVRQKLGRNSAMALRFCSDSYESQVFYNHTHLDKLSKIDIVRDNYYRDINARRKEIYVMCKKMKSVMQNLSFQLGTPYRKKEAQRILNEHTKLWKAANENYQKIKNLNSDLQNHENTKVTKQMFLATFRELQSFQCEFNKEADLHRQGREHLIAEMKAVQGNDRQVAQESAGQKQDLINEIDKRHRLFGRICTQLQLSKDAINKYINSQYEK